MMNAMLAVEKGNSLRHSAEMYGVPKSTLFDHVTGKVAFGARSGPDTYLRVEEEVRLHWSGRVISIRPRGLGKWQREVPSTEMQVDMKW